MAVTIHAFLGFANVDLYLPLAKKLTAAGLMRIDLPHIWGPCLGPVDTKLIDRRQVVQIIVQVIYHRSINLVCLE